MPLDDEQIERYSRQLVLPEVGPRGQARLATARVAIATRGAAAERVVAHLAAAGVGTLAVPPALRALVDPEQPGVVLVSLTDDADAPFDAALVDDDPGAPTARRTFWIGDGRGAELPPCRACVVAALGPAPAADAALAIVRDALLGTVIATEMLKALLEIGTPLGGRVLAYAPEDASITTAAIEPRPACPRCHSVSATGRA